MKKIKPDPSAIAQDFQVSEIIEPQYPPDRTGRGTIET